MHLCGISYINYFGTVLGAGDNGGNECDKSVFVNFFETLFSKY